MDFPGLLAMTMIIILEYARGYWERLSNGFKKISTKAKMYAIVPLKSRKPLLVLVHRERWSYPAPFKTGMNRREHTYFATAFNRLITLFSRLFTMALERVWKILCGW